MKIAFKKMSQIGDVPATCPGDWPGLVTEIEDSKTSAYENDGWLVMTQTEFDNYKVPFQAAYDDFFTQHVLSRFNPIVSPRQLRMALILSGINLQTIVAGLETLPEPNRSIALTEWEYALEYDRYNPTILGLALMLGFTENQLDDLWRLANQQ